MNISSWIREQTNPWVRRWSSVAAGSPEFWLLAGAVVAASVTEFPWYAFAVVMALFLVFCAIAGSLIALCFPRSCRPPLKAHFTSPFATFMELVVSWPMVCFIPPQSKCSETSTVSDCRSVESRNQDYADVEAVLNDRQALTDANIDRTAADAIHRAFCEIRGCVQSDPLRAGRLADAFHNLPLLLEDGSYEDVREETIRAIAVLHAK